MSEFLFGLALVIYGGTIGAWIAVAKCRKRLADKHRDGFIDGLNHGVRNHAIWINDRHLTHFPVNGFACKCPECGGISANLIMARDEYVTCRECGHRMPAPLAPERKEVAHGEGF